MTERTPIAAVPAEVRQPIVLEPQVRNKVLDEMRTMMVAVDGIAQGTAAGDPAVIECSARTPA